MPELDAVFLEKSINVVLTLVLCSRLHLCTELTSLSSMESLASLGQKTDRTHGPNLLSLERLQILLDREEEAVPKQSLQ